MEIMGLNKHRGWKLTWNSVLFGFTELQGNGKKDMITWPVSLNLWLIRTNPKKHLIQVKPDPFFNPTYLIQSIL